MKTVPAKIAEAFRKLKESTPFTISLKRINGRFYVYREEGTWDRARKKTVIKSEYVGRISDAGIFVKKRLSAKDDLENAKALIAQHGGEIVWHKEEAKEGEGIVERVAPTGDETDEKMLRILSTNGRASLALLSKLTGLSKSAVDRRRRDLEKRYGIAYNLEINMDKLGFSKYLIFVKFIGERPPMGKVREALQGQRRLQIAVATNGAYDLVLYFLAENNRAIASDIGTIRSSPELAGYLSEWYVTPFYETYGYMPVRREFFDLLAEKVWRKTRDNPHRKAGELFNREYVLLRELSIDGKKSFTEIDEGNSLPRNSARTAYEALAGEGIIKRMTINMQNIGKRYDGILMMKNINKAAVGNTRKELLGYIITEGEQVNKFSMVGDMGMPDGVVFSMPVMKEGELQGADELLRSRVKGTQVDILVVTEEIIGRYGYRSLDNAYSRQYEILVGDYKISPTREIISYTK